MGHVFNKTYIFFFYIKRRRKLYITRNRFALTFSKVYKTKSSQHPRLANSRGIRDALNIFMKLPVALTPVSSLVKTTIIFLLYFPYTNVFDIPVCFVAYFRGGVNILYGNINKTFHPCVRVAGFPFEVHPIALSGDFAN